MKLNYQENGFSLLELMISMVIGVFLIAGALRLYTQSHGALVVSERTARVQETARFAISVIERDVRASGLWGLINSADTIAGTGNPAAFNVLNDCTANWSVDVFTPIDGANNINPYENQCLPKGQYKKNTDVLIVRHVSENAVATANLRPGVIYVRSSANNGEMFVGTAQPNIGAPDAINSELNSVAYWISQTSDANNNAPSLKRTFLTTTGVRPEVRTEEIISGVEDMQVQYGIDTNGDNSVNMYVDRDAVVNTDSIVVTRVWLRVRSDQIEVGFDDTSEYIYADENYDPDNDSDTDADSYRRLLVTKTIEIRNRRASTL